MRLTPGPANPALGLKGIGYSTLRTRKVNKTKPAWTGKHGLALEGPICEEAWSTVPPGLLAGMAAGEAERNAESRERSQNYKPGSVLA